MNMLEKKTELEALQTLVEARFEKSTTIPEVFFTSQAERIAQACWSMARRFHQGGRLFALGHGAAATDAQHVSVEFVHPVIVGKRALPALALTNDSATLSGLMSGGATEQSFASQLYVLARPYDIAMGFARDENCPGIIEALTTARHKGLLTLFLLGQHTGKQTMSENADFSFVVPSDDPLVIQETHETLYHILWELVHIFFEHEGLFGER
jgi:D-sedoheptulose 7-phosphate isomerase